MSQTLQEFLDNNLHRVFPLEDSAPGWDINGVFQLPSTLISNLFLCVPDLPAIDVSKFYIQRIVIRTSFVDIYIGYDDAAVTEPLGVFKSIDTTAPVHSTYTFTPSELQTNDDFTPLYHMSGQITMGTFNEALALLGSWEFDYTNGQLVAGIISKGLLNVQYISINGRLFTGNVKLVEGANIVFEVDEQTVGSETITYITCNATLAADSDLQVVNDEDILTAFQLLYGGVPINTINGLLPDSERNFTLTAADCTTITPNQNGLTIENPCARPCCEEDENVVRILEDIANLNERYANLDSHYNTVSTAMQEMQNKLLVLGSTIE
jgi:hypothetical protein